MGPAIVAVPIAEIVITACAATAAVGLTALAIKKIAETNKKIQQRKEIMARIESIRKLQKTKRYPEYCKLFGIQVDILKDISKLDIDSLRNKYIDLIEEFRLRKKERIIINSAYYFFIQKYYKTTYEYFQQELIGALLQEDLQQLESILQKRPNLINFRQKGTNYTLLYLAVRTGSYEVVEFILNRTTNFDFSKDQSTPMHCAAYYGHYQIIGLLTRYGISLKIKNQFGDLPVEDAKTDEIKALINNAEKDNIHQLITQLSKKQFYLGQITIKHKNEEVARKIFLKNYKSQFSNFNNFDDAFHGTQLKNFGSIAQYGLKKAGDVAGDKKIKIASNHIQNKDWAQNVFTSPSIFYSGCPAYAPQIQFLNTRDKKTQIWLPILQVKLRKNTYRTNQTTTPYDHTHRQNQPVEIQYISQYKNEEERKNKIIVVAMILVKKSFLGPGMKYNEVTETILRSQQEKYFYKSFMNA